MHFLYIHIKKSSYDIPWTLLEMKQQVSIYEEYDFDPYAPSQDAFIQLEQYLLSNDCDCLISYLYIPEISDLCNKYTYRYICWVFDSPLVSLFHRSIQNPCNYLFIFDKEEYKKMCTWNIRHLYYLPMGTNTSRTGALDISIEDEQTYKSDVSFIGNLYENNIYDKFIHALPENIAAELKQYLVNHLCNWSDTKQWPCLSPESTAYIVQTMDPNQWNRYDMDFDLFLGVSLLSRKLAEMDRVTILNTLSEQFSVHLYTNSDCSCLQDYLKRVHIHPSAEYHTEMNKVFYLSKINLNVTLPSIETGIPQRVFDIMGAGGFVLTNYQAEMDDLFDIGEEIETFRNLDELKEKTAYYLSHEQERLRIALNGYRKVQNEFSYSHQMSKILQIVKEN